MEQKDIEHTYLKSLPPQSQYPLPTDYTWDMDVSIFLWFESLDSSNTDEGD